MARGAPAINVEQILRQRELQVRTGLLNITDIAEIELLFDLDDVVALNAHQWETGGLSRNPLPKTFQTKYSDQTALFTHNKATYDDDVEDIIAEDEIIRTFLPQTRTNNPDGNAAAMDIVRSRRTTIALLTHVGASAARPLVESEVAIIHQVPRTGET